MFTVSRFTHVSLLLSTVALIAFFILIVPLSAAADDAPVPDSDSELIAIHEASIAELDDLLAQYDVNQEKMSLAIATVEAYMQSLSTVQDQTTILPADVRTLFDAAKQYKLYAASVTDEDPISFGDVVAAAIHVKAAGDEITTLTVLNSLLDRRISTATDTELQTRAAAQDARVAAQRLEDQREEAFAQWLDVQRSNEAARQAASTQATTAQESRQNAARFGSVQILPGSYDAAPTQDVPYGVLQWAPLVAKYFPTNLQREALSVMWCESRGLPNAASPVSDARGLFQHKLKYWAPRAASAGFPGASVFHPEANIAASAWLVQSSINRGNDPWSHWACKPNLSQVTP